MNVIVAILFMDCLHRLGTLLNGFSRMFISRPAYPSTQVGLHLAQVEQSTKTNVIWQI